MITFIFSVISGQNGQHNELTEDDAPARVFAAGKHSGDSQGQSFTSFKRTV